MSNRCYLCGSLDAEVPLSLPDTFTAHNLARSPHSRFLCNFCDWALSLRCWYFNPNKNAWGKLFGRNWSTLIIGDRVVAPVISGSRTEGKTTLPIVRDLPTRDQIRQWILDPPEPPFRIVVAESGQKHILPWAQRAEDRNYFPVQFELDSVWVDRSQFAELLGHYESLMAIGFSKTEIDTGNYHSDRLMKAIRLGSQWGEHDKRLQPYRGSRLLKLLSYVASSN